MHLFSQLEEFDNMRTRVNSLANLRQAGPSLSCQLRPFILSPLQCPALSLTLYLLLILFCSIPFSSFTLCSAQFVIINAVIHWPIPFYSLLTTFLTIHHRQSCCSLVLSYNALSIYSQHSFSKVAVHGAQC